MTGGTRGRARAGEVRERCGRCAVRGKLFLGRLRRQQLFAICYLLSCCYAFALAASHTHTPSPATWPRSGAACSLCAALAQGEVSF